MSQSLSGKVALVVGGARNVGRLYALGMAQAGAQVAAVDRLVLPTEPGAPSLQELIETGRGLGPPILGLAADVRWPENIRRVVDETMAHFGRIDILVYNAMAAGYHDPLSVPDEHWDETIQVNLRAPYAFIRAVVPQMIERRSGAIVLMTTRASLDIPADDPAHKGLLAYGVTKAALNRIGSYFAEELKPHNIAVNMLSPGQVKKLSGGGPPPIEKFAPPMLHLVSQTAETMTGQWRNTTDYGVSWP